MLLKPLVRVLPYPSEQPDATVTEEQARELAVANFPLPGILHEFGSPGLGQSKSPDAEFMDWMGTLWKRDGVSISGHLTREMDPARANLKLDDWRDLIRDHQQPSEARLTWRRSSLPRLREIGQASSLFGVAASVGTVLGYQNPTQLELLEYSASVARLGAQPHFSTLTPVAIPLAAELCGRRVVCDAVPIRCRPRVVPLARGCRSCLRRCRIVYKRAADCARWLSEDLDANHTDA